MRDKDWYTQVRFSHLTKHAGPGAIVREQNDILIYVRDTSVWPDRDMTKLHAIERVKRHLGISKQLLLPPVASVEEKQNLKLTGGVVPTCRFPSWSVCDVCQTLHYKPWLKEQSKLKNAVKCPTCTAGILNQITWCAVSSTADLVDVPWHDLCHRQSKNGNCPVSLDATYMKLQLNKRGRWEVFCTKCSSKSVIEQTDFTRPFHHQPGRKERKSSSSEHIRYTVMEINDPRVFSPVSERALVIPPESNIDRESLAYKLAQHSQLVADIKNAKRALQKRREIKKALRLFRCDEQELLIALENLDKETSPTTSDFSHITTADMAVDEFEALTSPKTFSKSADFITTHLASSWHDLIDQMPPGEPLAVEAKIIDKLVAVDRLRVIEVYRGFQRQASDAEKFDQLPISAPDIEGSLNWLPAIELFGEGIFFTLDNEIIERWEQHDAIRKRAADIEQRYQNSDIVLADGASPTPRFIALHTLAHAFIRELESTAGYPAASLKERVYSSREDKMAGILIYTAVPDVSGSLGGLVTQAKPQHFLRLLETVMRKIEWCSMDPVCGEMEGQGPSWLNRAACHGCVLVPDTSCEYKNVLLDRVYITGQSSAEIPPLVEFVR